MRQARLLPTTFFATLALVAGFALFGSDAVAAEPKAVQPAAITKPDPHQTPTNLDVMVDKSVSVKLPAPAASVFIANPDIADIQMMNASTILVFGKKAGQTTLMANNNNGKLLAYRTVTVSHNLSDLRDALRTVIPGNKIKIESVPNGIVMTGEVADAAAVEDARRLAARYVPKDGGEIINRIQIRGNNQVQILVRFAEVSRAVDKRLGINWVNAAKFGTFAFGLVTGAAFTASSSPETWTRPTTENDSNNILGVHTDSRRLDVNGMIDALAKDGLVTILAEPSLTAMSGETASFLAGGEFPVPVPQSQSTISIEWKQYGVSLAFTPTIVGSQRINLHVRPEVSQLSDAGAVTIGEVQVPALTTRRAETTIELGSGQSFAIAGLLNNNQSQSVNKFPFLGDIPILGPLFRSTRFQNNESELVILITPYIVRPATQESLALPTDGYAPPTDTDRLLRLRQTNSDPEARTFSGDPRAVKVDEPEAASAPTPSPAPLMPVQPVRAREPAPLLPPEPASAPMPLGQSLPMSTPAPASKPRTLAPAGPGGFIME